MTPEPWVFVLLALAAFRAWKLVADDRILDRPREWVLHRIDVSRDSVYWQDFLVCPWCAGFWLSLLTYTGWIILGPGEWPGLVEFGVVTFAISAVVGGLGTLYFAVTEG